MYEFKRYLELVLRLEKWGRGVEGKVRGGDLGIIYTFVVLDVVRRVNVYEWVGGLI